MTVAYNSQGNHDNHDTRRLTVRYSDTSQVLRQLKLKSDEGQEVTATRGRLK